MKKRFLSLGLAAVMAMSLTDAAVPIRQRPQKQQRLLRQMQKQREARQQIPQQLTQVRQAACSRLAASAL